VAEIHYMEDVFH